MKHYSKEERAMWLEDWRQSEKSAWTYARENGIVPQTFVRWTQKGIENKNGFVKVPLPVKPKPNQVNEILIEKGEIKIHIPLCISSNEFRFVMEGLQA